MDGWLVGCWMDEWVDVYWIDEWLLDGWMDFNRECNFTFISVSQLCNPKCNHWPITTFNKSLEKNTSPHLH